MAGGSVRENGPHTTLSGKHALFPCSRQIDYTAPGAQYALLQRVQTMGYMLAVMLGKENMKGVHGRPHHTERVKGKSRITPHNPHLLLNVVSFGEGASDWFPKKGHDGADGAQQADLVLCSAAHNNAKTMRVSQKVASISAHIESAHSGQLQTARQYTHQEARPHTRMG